MSSKTTSSPEARARGLRVRLAARRSASSSLSISSRRSARWAKGFQATKSRRKPATNTHPRIGQAATALLGLLTSLALYQLLRAREDQASAELGGWLRCVLLSFVIADTIVMTEPLFALLQTTSILVLFAAQPTPRRIVLLGLLVGGCMLTREPAIVYPFLFGIWVSRRSPRPWQKVRYVALFLAAIGLALLPWLARNHMVLGHALPLSYTASSNLHIGNNPDATGAFVDLSARTPRNVPWGGPAFDRWHRTEAIAYIVEHPWRFMIMGFRKVALFLFPRFLRDDLLTIYHAPAHLATLVSLLSGALSASLVLAGVVGLTVHRRDALWSFLVVLCIYSLVTTFVALGHPRFRDAVDHLLLYYAAYLVTHWRAYFASVRSGDRPIGVVSGLLPPPSSTS